MDLTKVSLDYIKQATKSLATGIGAEFKAMSAIALMFRMEQIAATGKPKELTDAIRDAFGATDKLNPEQRGRYDICSNAFGVIIKLETEQPEMLNSLVQNGTADNFATYLLTVTGGKSQEQVRAWRAKAKKAPKVTQALEKVMAYLVKSLADVDQDCFAVIHDLLNSTLENRRRLSVLKQEAADKLASLQAEQAVIAAEEQAEQDAIETAQREVVAQAKAEYDANVIATYLASVAIAA